MSKEIPRIVLVARAAPNAIGGGGSHRTYQLQWDLQQAFGAENVKTLSWTEWKETRASRAVSPKLPLQRLRRLLHVQQILDSIAYYRENPARLYAKTTYSPRRYSKSGFMQHYLNVITKSFVPDLCIVEHSGLGDIIDYNIKHNIPTIASPQNLEALDTSNNAAAHFEGLRATLYDLNNEINLLRCCKANLFISKIETAFIAGLGFPNCYYYPYIPVGDVAAASNRIRQRRSEEGQERGLFLMIGTGSHATTLEGFKWFITQAAQQGLPTGVRIIIGGNQTQRLLNDGNSVPQIEIRGWLDQPELEDYLVRAEAVLVPQLRGFGALTRLAELSLANIPTLVSWHPTFAINVPPHIHALSNLWQSWQAKMVDIMKGTLPDEGNTFEHWAACQPNPLEVVIRNILS
jgi:hypothetical protein